MLNSGLKKEALANLGKAEEAYMKKYQLTVKETLLLHETRMKSVEAIKLVEDLVNRMANTPKEFEKIVSEVVVQRRAFESEVFEIEREAERDEKLVSGVTGAGVASGVGVAALGPSAAMAIATTFGTASTGTAISALTGAAATNAAVAWLGGGALAAGGGGMLAGKALLALAGPVGWSIGGVALVGGGLMATSKNKKIAEKAEKATVEMKKELNIISKVYVKVSTLAREVNQLRWKIHPIPTQLIGATNYLELSKEQKDEMLVLVNTTQSLSKKLVEKID